MKQIDIQYGFGVITGVALAFSLVSFINWLPDILDFEKLKQWQELVGAVVSIFAAALALLGIWWQLRHSQLDEEAKRERQAYAARAMMAHGLSSICYYASDCVNELRALVDGQHPPKDPETVTLPVAFKLRGFCNLPLGPLEQTLQFGEKEIQDCIAHLMQQLQIQHSRITNRSGHVQDGVVFARWFHTLIGDALELHATASALFLYARGDTESIPTTPTPSDMCAAANFFALYDTKWSELHKFLKHDWKPRTFYKGATKFQ